MDLPCRTSEPCGLPRTSVAVVAVQHVVVDLEREPDVHTEPAEARQLFGIEQACDTAHHDRRMDQRAGLAAMEGFEFGLIERAVLACEVEDLAADHPVMSGGLGKQSQPRPRGGVVDFGARDDLEGERLQGIAGEDRGRFVEAAVHCRTPAS